MILQKYLFMIKGKLITQEASYKKVAIYAFTFAMILILLLLLLLPVRVYATLYIVSIDDFYVYLIINTMYFPLF